MNNAAFTGPRRRPGGAAGGGIAPPPLGAESPIPQQWWEQDAAAAAAAAAAQQQQQQNSNYPYYPPNNNASAVKPRMMNGHDTTTNTKNNTSAQTNAIPASYYQHHRPGTPSQSASQFASSYANNRDGPAYGYNYRGAATPPPPSAKNGTTSPSSFGSNPSNTTPTLPPPPANAAPHPPSSTGLIRLSLRKPMGIVFEPMTDARGQQRGVRICDLPRTGAAALSRKLEVGDELLSINDKTMSRLTFDEIMDFIIEADPERVNLLFRRPRKEALVQKPIGGGANSVMSGAGGNSVKWVDDQVNAKKERDKNRERERGRDRSTSVSASERVKPPVQSSKSKKKKKGGIMQPWESESFLDMLIDSLCSPLVQSDQGCKKERERERDSEYSDYEDEDATYQSADDSTYVTYESVPQETKRRGRNDAAKKNQTVPVDKRRNDRRGRRDDDSTVDNETIDEETVDEDEEETVDEETVETAPEEVELDDRHRRKAPHPKHLKLQNNRKGSTHSHSPDDKAMIDRTRDRDRSRGRSRHAELPSQIEKQPAYTDDNTLETVDSNDRALEQQDSFKFPLGLSPPWKNKPKSKSSPARTRTTKSSPAKSAKTKSIISEDGSSAVDLPIEELEYDDQVDGADVSVMTPSLTEPYVSSTALLHGRGNYTPHEPGMTVDESIQKSPQRFYRHVIQHLLETHEPEKVRLIDKLMAKYKGREEHLIQKLTLRYNRQNNTQKDLAADKHPPTITEDESYKEERVAKPEQTQPIEAPKQAETDKKSSTSSHSHHSLVSSNNDSLNSFVSGFTGKSFNQSLPSSNAKSKSDVQDTAVTTSLNDINHTEADTAAWSPPPTIPETKQSESLESTTKEDRYETTAPPSFEDPPLPPVEEAPEPFTPIPPKTSPEFTPKPLNTEPTPSKQPTIPKPTQSERSHSTSSTKKTTSETPPTLPPQPTPPSEENTSVASGSYTEDGSEYTTSSIDGTSPAVIAQVSELLNYVYGKTSVPGQIDRVSTIMRAYEGREAVLLELLETKALIKANAQNEQSQVPQGSITSPLSMSGPSISVGGEFVGREMHDDISSVSGASSRFGKGVVMQDGKSADDGLLNNDSSSNMPLSTTTQSQTALTKESSKQSMSSELKKKKSIFGMFRGKSGKKSKKKNGGFPSGDEGSASSQIKSKNSFSKKGLLRDDSEASI